MKLCGPRGRSFITSTERSMITVVKEKHCYAALYPQVFFEIFFQKFSQDETLSPEVDILLLDGQKITLGNELHKAVEPYFNPSLIGLYGEG